MGASIPQPPPASGDFALGRGVRSPQSKPWIVATAVATVLALAMSLLALSVTQAKGHAEAAKNAAIAGSDTAKSNLSSAQAQISSLEDQKATAEAQVQSLQNQVDASAWKVQAYARENACIDAIIAAYNAVTYLTQLGSAMDNTFHNGACERVFSFSAKNS
jgi:uncharacterized protein HemX